MTSAKQATKVHRGHVIFVAQFGNHCHSKAYIWDSRRTFAEQVPSNACMLFELLSS